MEEETALLTLEVEPTPGGCFTAKGTGGTPGSQGVVTFREGETTKSEKFTFLGAAPAPAPAPAPVPAAGLVPMGFPAGVYTQLFNDLMTVFNPLKWLKGWWEGAVNTPSGPDNGNENATYADGNLEYGSNGLDLNLTKVPSTDAKGSFANTGAQVSTRGCFALNPGTIYEVECTLADDGTGKIANWPQVWDTTPPSETYNESDLLEGLGGVAAVHFHPGSFAVNLPNIKPGKHTLSKEWSLDGKTFTYRYDGQVVGTYEPPAPVLTPSYLILTHSVSDQQTAVECSFNVSRVTVFQIPA
jgi:hypothetical protein